MTPKERLKCIRKIIEDVDRRCMAVDGPVTPTWREISDDELREIYRLTLNAEEAKQWRKR